MLEATKTIVVPSPLGCGNLPDGGSYIIMSYLRFRPFGMVSAFPSSCHVFQGNFCSVLLYVAVHRIDLL